MPDARFTIANIEELSPTGALARLMGEEAFPRTSRAVLSGLRTVRNYMIKEAAQRMKNPSGSWARGVRIVQFGPFDGAVVSTAPHHSIVEEGHKEIRMKDSLKTSKKVRVSKRRKVKGKMVGGWRYLIIPFRHKYDDVPADVRQFLEDEGRSKVTEIYAEASQQQGVNEMVTRYSYKWGGRYMGLGDNDRLAGLVKMGRKKHGGYYTFRVMSENPLSKADWVIQPHKGHHIMRDAGRMIQTSGINDVIVKAMKADIRNVLKESARA